jgi:hypothetical protein
MILLKVLRWMASFFLRKEWKTPHRMTNGAVISDRNVEFREDRQCKSPGSDMKDRMREMQSAGRASRGISYPGWV